jgi:hypothetical protein
MDTNIRLYRSSDQQQVFEISADTAFFGEPVEVFLEDRHLYIDTFACYYIAHEAPHTWVADCREVVIRLLFGCSDTTLQSKK